MVAAATRGHHECSTSTEQTGRNQDGKRDVTTGTRKSATEERHPGVSSWVTRTAVRVATVSAIATSVGRAHRKGGTQRQRVAFVGGPRHGQQIVANHREGDRLARDAAAVRVDRTGRDRLAVSGDVVRNRRTRLERLRLEVRPLWPTKGANVLALIL